MKISHNMRYLYKTNSITLKNITIVLLAGYTDLFTGKYEDALKKIEKYPLEVVLFELVGINFRLRDSTSLYIDVSVKSQIAFMKHWLGEDEYVFDIFKRLDKFSSVSNGRQPIIFNRAGCLYGIDYCYRNLKGSNDKFEYTKAFWIDLIEFCLACNDIVTQYESKGDAKEINLLEHINAQQAILNELKIVSNPILAFNRYIDLIQYIERDVFYQKELSEYLTSLGLSPKTFIEITINIYLNKGQNKKIPFLIWLSATESPDAFKLVTWLSNNTLLKKKHDLDLLTLYKWPIFKYEKEKFVILDPELLLDKIYRQFISDFYFDHLKDKGITYQDYRSFIGQFFEKYIANSFKGALSLNSAITYKHTGQLKFGNPEKELCDVYIRHKRNVLLGQIKSTNFSDEQKFKGSYEFYNGDTVRFYKDVGVTQIVQSIEWLNNHSTEIDQPLHKKTKLYPVLILNDKFFETPFMSQVLDTEFKRQLSTIANRFIIKDLVVMNVTSVERLHAKKMNNGRLLWKLFWNTTRFSGILPHFNNTLDRFKIQFHPKKELKRVSGYLQLKKK